MNISLTVQLEALVKQKVASGLYNSSSEVIREALRLMEKNDRLREAQIQEVRNVVQAGLDSGAPVGFDENALSSIKARGRERLTIMQKNP